MLPFVVLSLALCYAAASPLERRSATYSAASDVGLSMSEQYPPAGTTVNTAAFPGESVVGNTGPTPTGVEPFAIETAAAYPDVQQAFAPLVVPTVGETTIFEQWGNLSPMHSFVLHAQLTGDFLMVILHRVNSSQYGLSSASPLAPENCEITQVHLLYRHGARYPTTGSGPSAFAAALHNASAHDSGYTATGPLAFLNTWTYKLGAELLTPFGRQQNFNLGVSFRTLYGHLLSNFTETGTLPVFRTESQDRMVKTALNFAAGFFGIPYDEQFNLLLMVEATGVNNTGAPYDTCNNSNNALGSLGTTAANAFAATAFASTAQRLNGYISGFNVTTAYVIDMLQLCAYETHALGYSKFCSVFTAEEFSDFEYYYDIEFYYNNFMGSPVAAAQGKGWVEEFVARLTQTPINSSDSAVNTTLDNSLYLPLNQSIYADATHEVVVSDILSALNLTGLGSAALPLTAKPSSQVLECSSSSPTKQIRFIVNDAVVPIDNYPGCTSDPNGLCAFDTVVSALQQRLSEIDFNYACFANYTATAGQDYNGLAPKSS